jgi:hypothetical protein
MGLADRSSLIGPEEQIHENGRQRIGQVSHGTTGIDGDKCAIAIEHRMERAWIKTLAISIRIVDVDTQAYATAQSAILR